MKSISQIYLQMRNRGKQVPVVEDREPSIGGTSINNMGQPVAQPYIQNDDFIPIAPKRR